LAVSAAEVVGPMATVVAGWDPDQWRTFEGEVKQTMSAAGGGRVLASAEYSGQAATVNGTGSVSHRLMDWTLCGRAMRSCGSHRSANVRQAAMGSPDPTKQSRADWAFVKASAVPDPGTAMGTSGWSPSQSAAIRTAPGLDNQTPSNGPSGAGCPVGDKAMDGCSIRVHPAPEAKRARTSVLGVRVTSKRSAEGGACSASRVDAASADSTRCGPSFD